MDNIKKWIGIGVPGGLDDIIIRAVKTAIMTFIGLVGANVIGWTDLSAVQGAGGAALAAGASVLINAIALWASS